MFHFRILILIFLYFRSQAIQMHPLRQGIHPALFTGKSRKESARSIVQLRLQAEAHEDVRVRGVRTHRQRSGGTLRTPAGQPPT